VKQTKWLPALAAVVLVACGGSDKKVETTPPPPVSEPAPPKQEEPKKAAMAEQALADIARYADEVCACKDSGCAQQVTAKFEQEIGEKYQTMSQDDLTEEQNEKLMKTAMRASECQAALLVAEIPTDPKAWRIGVAECDSVIDSYLTCDKLPPQARAAFWQGAQQWKVSLESGGNEARTALIDSCKQVVEATKEALDSVGCAPPAPPAPEKAPDKKKKKKKKG
jgi:hypothetical protein